MEMELNTPQNRYKIYNFTLTVSSVATMVSAVWDDCGRRLRAVCSIELAVCNFRIKWSYVCLKKSLWAENLLYSCRF